MSKISIDKIWVLRLGSVFLGVEPKALKEVLEITQLTPIPLAPPPLLGLLSKQGQIVSVFDLSQVLQLPPTGSDLAALLEVEGQSIAFTIDEVSGLRTNLGGVWATPSQEPLFSAVLEDAGKNIRILNPSSLLAHLTARISATAPAPTSAIRTTPFT
ncbi:chemotaxis protein CheW [Meiothermus taiwanensis]|jgi:purine-binding chemotaxis protein CheW|uniref:CheW-like domain protein n=2 Tax=Meiothermus taiwanensis TaxID=172827 RepID=A0A399DUF0_9DEIN|nr:chemotaxis protein CheW [Meiothermus taiwanensis]AWR85911.1 chemotaxis signal transduction protein [Meiothermus taiwanensis WR-220]KIQ54664.1 chemotaxis protein CheW [Meiothermus taiwanensis]KZK15501.1 chemotaxis protein CheW [Meiothermus taiwanensis]RIH75814.1 CheW-like domain protein [Meiothermus taiwanensis]